MNNRILGIFIGFLPWELQYVPYPYIIVTTKTLRKCETFTAADNQNVL